MVFNELANTVSSSSLRPFSKSEQGVRIRIVLKNSADVGDVDEV